MYGTKGCENALSIDELLMVLILLKSIAKLVCCIGSECYFVLEPPQLSRYFEGLKCK